MYNIPPKPMQLISNHIMQSYIAKLITNLLYSTLVQ